MTNPLLTLLLSASLCTHADAQDTTLLKRSPYKLKVAVDKKTSYEEDLRETPYILPNNTIQLYPGEAVFVEVEVADGAIKSMKAVKEIKDSTRTLSLSFTQIVNGKVHEQMILSIKNPFAYKLSYKATIFLLKQKKWVRTDVLPLAPGLAGFETWTDIVTSIGLGQWTFEK